MAPKVNRKGKSELVEVKLEKPKAYWTQSNKKLFLDLALEEKHMGNRPGKAFNVVGWENIVKAFNKRTSLQYEYLQFKNLYGQLRSNWQTWMSLIKNMGLGYDPDAKTFTLDNERWDFIIKLKEFQYKPLQFEEEFNNLFIRNSTIGENTWVPKGDDPRPNEVPMADDLDQDAQTEYMESFNTTCSQT